MAVAASALRAGNRDKARRLLDTVLAEFPDDPDALTLMAWVSEDEGLSEESTSFLRRAVAVDPSPERRIGLATHLKRYGSADLAIEEIEALPQTVRRRGPVASLYVRSLRQAGKHLEEIAAYRDMLELEPGNPGIWVNLGYALITVGRIEEAVGAVKRAIHLKPTFGASYWALANFKSYRFTVEELNQMRDLVARSLPLEDALNLNFALGKAYEDTGQYESSFRHYAAGNALRAKTLISSQIAITGTVDDLIQHCTSDVFTRADEAGCRAADPIFIVGLHRSGSTLVEQILASHPLIEGTGELKAMHNLARRLDGLAPRTLGEVIATLDPSELTSIGEEYLQRARAFRRTDRPYFIDKLPRNWSNLPLIRLALPRAKIIDARRHPMACGFSNFTQNYAAGVVHSYHLRWMGEHYRDYWRFMQHFQEQQPGVIHSVINERLVEDPEGETRRLLDYVGVPPDQSCFEFYKNARAVSTPSAEQVRRPLNRDGFDRWRNYEPWLGELKTALGDALERWDG
jgi:tetratricopeptide (TPR) repeat protein